MLPIGDKDAIYVTSVLHATTITSLPNANCQHPLQFYECVCFGSGGIWVVYVYMYVYVSTCVCVMSVIEKWRYK